MVLHKIAKFIGLILLYIQPVNTGISPVHDFKNQYNARLSLEKMPPNSPHRVIKHLDESIQRSTANVTQNSAMEENLYQMAKDLVSAILSKLEIQDKITRITREALDAPGKVKGMKAIETRRILDYISKTLSGHILTLTRASTDPELHRLVYGLGQIAAEVSIVSALKDITYAIALSKKQSADLSFRKKRSILIEKLPPPATTVANIEKKIAVRMNPGALTMNFSNFINNTKSGNQLKLTPYSVISTSNKNTLHVIPNKSFVTPMKVFLNKTVLDLENQGLNDTATVLLQQAFNSTQYPSVISQTLDNQDARSLVEDIAKENEFSMSQDGIAELEMDIQEADDENAQDKKAKQKLGKLEVKAKKAILHAGDVAYLTASSVVAMRRALTASIEVQMSVNYAKNGMSNHQDLMMNLAKTAAQQAGKEAKSATSKSLACDRVLKMALKYTAQSKGAKLNHVATRITMETLSLATLAKSMAFVSSDIAINSLYSATDVKPPS